MLESSKLMRAERKKYVAEMYSDLATTDPQSRHARDLRHTIRMNEIYLAEPYTDAFQENSQGNVEMGMSG